MNNITGIDSELKTVICSFYLKPFKVLLLSYITTDITATIITISSRRNKWVVNM